MFLLRASRMFLILSLIYISSNEALSAVPQTQTEDYFKFLTRLNTNSPLEHAGSHGTMGLGLGLGLGVYYAGVDAAIFREHWRSLEQEPAANSGSQQRLVMPKVYFHKGLPWALDLGLAMGQDVSTKAKVISSHVQWTPLEAFAAPSIGVRAGVSRLMGLATTDASSASVDGVLSYGFLGVFTVYGTIGLSRHQIEIRSGDEYGTSLALTRNGYGSVEKIMICRSRSFGFQLQALPPFVVSTVEVQLSGDAKVSYLAKMSLGM